VVVVVAVFALFLGLVDVTLSHVVQRLLAPRLS
jgi:preprotein translocase subunit SecE